MAGVEPSEVPVRVKLLEDQVDALGEVVRDLLTILGQVTALAFARDELALTEEERLERLRENDKILREALTRLEGAWETEAESE